MPCLSGVMLVLTIVPNGESSPGRPHRARRPGAVWHPAQSAAFASTRRARRARRVQRRAAASARRPHACNGALRIDAPQRIARARPADGRRMQAACQPSCAECARALHRPRCVQRGSAMDHASQPARADRESADQIGNTARHPHDESAELLVLQRIEAERARARHTTDTRAPAQA